MGTEWDHRIITYFFQNGTGDIVGDGEQQAIRDGFALWSAQTDLAFLEVCNANVADIVILWDTFAHGDPDPPCIGGACDFDGQANPATGTGVILAHALGGPPPNDFGDNAGDIHFDDSENWTLNTRGNHAQPIDLVTVAAHEIGHSLGLDHTTVAGSLMEAIYTGSHRFLGADDIAGIQSIYGLPNSGALIDGPAALCSTGSYTIQDVPAGISVSWTASPSGIFTNSSGTGITANLNLVNPSTVAGAATLTYTLQGAGCADTEITRKIQVGPEYPDFDFYQYPSCVSPNQVVTVVANITQVDYDWTVNGGTILSGQGTQSIDIMVGSGGSIAVHCYVSNGPEACGGPKGTVSLYPMGCFAAEDSSVTAYPNPASDILHLKSETEEKFTGEIVFVDSQNNPRKSVSADSCEVAIDVSDLQPGVYHVTYTIGDRYQIKRIKIE